MPRGPRICYPHAVLHVINRFIDRHPFFQKREDYRKFLDTYFAEAESFGIWTYAYDLLPNHFHIILETPSGEISPFLQRWLTRAAQELNRRHKRVGHMMQGRTKTLVVQTERYFQTVMGYVLVNNVRAGLADSVFKDQWNSVEEMLKDKGSRLAREPLWEYLFGHGFDERRIKEHRRECVDWLKGLDVGENERVFQEGHHGGFLSTPDFRRRILKVVERRRNLTGAGLRRKTDRYRKRWTWREIVSAAKRVIGRYGYQKGRWKSQESAMMQIRCYAAHVGGCWKWDQIREFEAQLGHIQTGYPMMVSRIRNDPDKLRLAEAAIKMLI